MSDRTALVHQMIAQHVKILDRHIQENNHEQIAIWQSKVDKLRAQVDDKNVASQTAAPTNYAPQPAYTPYSAPASAPVPQQQAYYAPQQAAQTQHSDPSREILAKDQEMQELRIANAKLREQLAQKEDILSRDNRMYQMQETEMNLRIQELLSTQSNFDGALAEKTSKIESLHNELNEAERRGHDLLNQQNAKAAAALHERERELEEYSRAIHQAEQRAIGVLAEIASQQENALRKISDAIDEKDCLQGTLDLLRADIRAKQEEIETAQRSLASISRVQEEEAKKLADFVSKSIGAINVATSSAQGGIVVKSKADVGFANITLKCVVNENL